MNCSIETFMKLDCFALLFCFILLCYMSNGTTRYT